MLPSFLDGRKLLFLPCPGLEKEDRVEKEVWRRREWWVRAWDIYIHDSCPPCVLFHSVSLFSNPRSGRKWSNSGVVDGQRWALLSNYCLKLWPHEWASYKANTLSSQNSVPSNNSRQYTEPFHGSIAVGQRLRMFSNDATYHRQLL